MTRDAGPDPAERLGAARRAVGGSLATLLGFALLLVLLAALADGAGVAWAALPAGLAGIVAPAIGYRLYRRGLRATDFVRAHVRAMRATEFGGFLGLLGWLVSDDWTALTGLLTHTLLAGAIWPTPERLAQHDEDRA